MTLILLIIDLESFIAVQNANSSIIIHFKGKTYQYKNMQLQISINFINFDLDLSRFYKATLLNI
jgi:hypothetical protein